MRDKRERFLTLAENRVNRLLKEIQLVGNLGNRANYQYTADEVRKIFVAIETEIKTARRRFDERTDSADSGFKL
ncbi:hypothetical protein ACFQZQ_12535 [Lysobacter koreensis]|uniref:Uncharacterized protein n=1 Tax=Lysobacter koreensis TaxID=266122 RepID=A0ABW2YUF5_9GAMM